jgi:hypothetical protein
VKSNGYLVKLAEEDRYWSEDARSFVTLDDPVKPTIMDIDWAMKFAVEFGVESRCIYKICNHKGKVLKSYSKEVESDIWMCLGF